MREPRTITLALDRLTKNTARYDEQPEEGQAPIIGTLYVQKHWTGSEPPRTITVQISTT